MGKFGLRPLEPKDSDWVTQRMIESWGAETVVVHETIYHPAQLPGFAAQDGEEVIGLLTYHYEAASCEIVTLNAWRAGRGVGTALIEAVKQVAVREGCRRLWLVTTNDKPERPALLPAARLCHFRHPHQCCRKIPALKA